MEEKSSKTHPRSHPGPWCNFSLSGWLRTPAPSLLTAPTPTIPSSPRPLAPLVVCGPQESAKLLERRGSGKLRRTSDVRNLWTTGTLSLQQLNTPLPTVSECSDSEDESADHKTQIFDDRKAVPASVTGWDEQEEREDITLKDKESFTQEVVDEHIMLGMELHRSGSVGSDLEEGVEDAKPNAQTVRASVSSHSLSKHTPHRAYWAEQQNRLPLPLTELMEQEALEILTKALYSYRSRIGWDHFLTKQLQRHIEGLRKRRYKRLNVLPQ
ncbi:cation channel sperm-associated protein subunit zeta [Choloepus didactylus]|uniref:cation channel sperm-associated protein subunit zeta n=1 Tax=Choloepus didactylus TaxID=27675 RepID=UPI00189F5A5B|nr:cation channel sperm-associated protein subunit zeta [Choloepus didactylus]